MHPKAVSETTVNGKTVVIARFERQSTPVVALWFGGESPRATCAYERGDVTVPVPLRYNRPVWVDLLTGKACEFPERNVSRRPDHTVLKGVPLWDPPILIAESGQVPRRLPSARISFSQSARSAALACMPMATDAWASP